MAIANSVWSDVYGLDFSVVKSSAIKKGYLRTPDSKVVITTTARIFDLDLQTIQLSKSTFKSLPFQIEALRDDTVHAFLAWFDYDFTHGSKPVEISTGPFSKSTHWKQTVFYLDNPVNIKRGEIITGDVSFEQSERDLNVRLNYTVSHSSSDVTNGVDGKHTVNGIKPTASGSGLYKVYVHLTTSPDTRNFTKKL